MGYSPHDPFFTIEGKEYHWEIKDTHVVLWNKDESEQLLRLNFAHALSCLDQLHTCLLTKGIHPW